MRVSALTMAGLRLKDENKYRLDMIALIKNSGANLVVLPAYSALILGLETGGLAPDLNFSVAFQHYIDNNINWNNRFKDLHSALSSELKVYLAAGTLIESFSGRHYHTACCFNPAGEICGTQKQTHLTRAEREIGISRGEELNTFYVNDFQAGLVVGNDARHPEVGRIFALRGANLLLHCGAIEAGFNCWPQVAGMWSQVQQNQFWSVEAQLSGAIGDKHFGAPPAVLGPCEITPGQSGYLSRGYPHSSLITAELDEKARRRIRQKYPILDLLNLEAYTGINKDSAL